MQVTIELPDNLSLAEADLRQEVAIALFQQKESGEIADHWLRSRFGNLERSR
ncbi:hypothetical protein [Phormidesmis priestleyi]|uniref:hypothetical protein n=1 Tax=Phormidesmis priestleyi TaxID=268141 RepID=UPI000A7CA7CF|nr:hypothetical protein [Phormidesmis priestleyi]